MIIATAQDAAELFRACFDESEEEGTLAVAFLDSGRRLIECFVVPPAPGGTGEIPVRRILEDALRLGASGLVLATDRAGGDVQPTEEEIDSVRELGETAARLGIRLHDYLIFGGTDDVLSTRSLGLL